ncbi:hypothetical protein [Sphingomonas sp. PP-CE-1G-424]|nr:hypothetical protein [Sphingomonas sp. PP-CE-1G-424]
MRHIGTDDCYGGIDVRTRFKRQGSFRMTIAGFKSDPQAAPEDRVS